MKATSWNGSSGAGVCANVDTGDQSSITMHANASTLRALLFDYPSVRLIRTAMQLSSASGPRQIGLEGIRRRWSGDLEATGQRTVRICHISEAISGLRRFRFADEHHLAIATRLHGIADDVFFAVDIQRVQSAVLHVHDHGVV